MRDTFRTIKATLRLDLFSQKDNNDIYFVDDHILKMEYPLKEDQVLFGANKIEEVIATYLQGMDVYYSIIPDKNYFVAEDNGYLHLDYERMAQLMNETVEHAQYIDVFDLLSLDDYYRTDAHWKQQDIFPVAEALANAMELGADLIPEGGFETNEMYPFEGVYWGQSALPVDPDTLTYLISSAIDAATMTSIEFQGESGIYTPEKFGGVDGYDVFAAGAQAILVMESPEAKTTKELIIFRDSYGSSIAPLFLEGYSKITLIDLRYIATSFLGDYVEFENQDVLFMYSTSILNSSMLLK